jgi:hypothetical protein
MSIVAHPRYRAGRGRAIDRAFSKFLWYTGRKEYHVKKIAFIVFLSVLALAWTTSCASSPKKGTTIQEDVLQSRESAESSRKKAVEIKAPVAAKASFQEADVMFEGAKTAEAASEFEKARDGYRESEKLFTASYEEASAKRDKANAALGKAADERTASEEALSKMSDAETATEEEDVR